MKNERVRVQESIIINLKSYLPVWPYHANEMRLISVSNEVPCGSIWVKLGLAQFTIGVFKAIFIW